MDHRTELVDVIRRVRNRWRVRLALRGAETLGGPGAPGVAGRTAGLLQKIASAPGGGCSDCPAATLTPAERSKRQQQE